MIVLGWQGGAGQFLKVNFVALFPFQSMLQCWTLVLRVMVKGEIKNWRIKVDVTESYCFQKGVDAQCWAGREEQRTLVVATVV